MEDDNRNCGYLASGSPADSEGPPLNNNEQPPEIVEQGNEGDEVRTEGSVKPNVSARKIEANRLNSRRSTGPRTAAGKRRTFQNAVTHGFYTKYLLIPGGKENDREYGDLHAAICKHYQPVGWLEEFRVEEIAISSWRRRRLLRSERGLIAKALAQHTYNCEEARALDRQEPDSAPSSRAEIDALTDHLFLPEREEVDKLLRVEAMINRQLNDAIAELERLQAMRREGSTHASVGSITKQSQEAL